MKIYIELRLQRSKYVGFIKNVRVVRIFDYKRQISRFEIRWLVDESR